ncbi:uncharacterized protein LOC133347664 [Lethenteron reissneri]|uniref:uncharacterized protein LOC133347664 n=1 Tax=Lethenteron reissneri TaxID=7753 RepID=UPI002AB66EFF|nr:uncharacterized protein LOC133347664 [Lethenteron reissneri]
MTKFLLLLLNVSAFGVIYLSSAVELPRLLYTRNVDCQVGFLNVLHNPVPSADGRSVYDLSLSCFASFSKHPDNVSAIFDVGQKFHDASLMTPTPITTHVAWPNEVEQVPDGIFPSNYYWTCSEGFMVGGKDNGRVSLWDMSRGPTAVDGVLTLTVDETGNKWFYHRVEWVDMDHDGLKDALTARAQSTGPTGNGQLIWFKNPGLMGGQVQEFWKENVLHEGPDVYFRAVQLPLPNGGTKMAIVSTVFWGQQLTVTWTSDPSDNWSDSSKTMSRVIDTEGWYFDLKFVDLNGDGRKDILATTWSQQGKDGKVLAYEIPDDFMEGTWTKHVLASGYTVHSIFPGNGSPGAPKTFFPRAGSSQKKPTIVLAGDDDGKAYILESVNDNDSNQWAYSNHTLFDAGGIVGEIAVEDVDGDGFMEIFIPEYSKQLIAVFSYKPVEK